MQGEQKGEIKFLLHLMEKKYGQGAVSPWRQQIEQADSESLLSWSERILTANAIDEVFH